METSLPPTLHKLAGVTARTGLSRSALYRLLYHPEKNPTGRLKVIKIGRAVRISESELARFIESLEQ